PGTLEMLAKYRVMAKDQGIDPLGYAFAPMGYAAGQVLAQAVEGTKSLDHKELAAYMRTHTFPTVVGDIEFGKEGERKKARVVFTEYQNVTGNTLDQFSDTSRQVVVWPSAFKTGAMIYPYAKAKQK